MRNVLTYAVEKVHILYSITFFFENRAVCDNAQKYGGAKATNDVTVWLIRVGCWTS
jgi:hypothetical protein